MSTENVWTLQEKISLQSLKTLIQNGDIDEGIPRMKVVRSEQDGSYIAMLKGFKSCSGDTIEDALSAMHNSLLDYYEKLSSPKTHKGPMSQEQLNILESYLRIPVCDCGQSPDSYCYCRGFSTE